VLTVIQWNILAISLSPPSAFPRVDEDTLSVSTRLPLIIQYLSYPLIDVILLEEVDYSEDIINRMGGYWEWIYAKKGGGKDGCLIGVRKDTGWRVVHGEGGTHYYTGEGQTPINRLFLHAVIEHISTGTRVSLVNTHLKAKRENEHIRISESTQLAQFIKNITDSGDRVIVSGDFNSEPHEMPIKNIVDMGMRSIREGTKGQRFSTATYHNATDNAIREIDYIFYSKGIVLREGWWGSTLKIGYNYLPTRTMPSDHVPLYAIFELPPKYQTKIKG